MPRRGPKVEVGRSLQVRIAEQLAKLPRGSQAARVLEVVQTNPQFASYASARDMAQRAGVNASTVTRAARQMGFGGWPDLQLEVRSQYLSALSTPELLDRHSTEMTETPARAALHQDADHLSRMAHSLDPDEIKALAAAIMAAPRTLVAASGSFAAPAIVLSYVGTGMGFDLRLETQAGTERVTQLAGLPPGGCLVIFNFWRTPRELITMAQAASRRDLTVCLVTDRRTSRLAQVADVVVAIPSESTSIFPTLTPAVAVSQAVLAELAAGRPEQAARATSDIEALWGDMDLMAPSTVVPDPGQ